MANRFIELKLANFDETEVINFDLVRKFYRSPGSNFTVIEFGGKDEVTVKETPAEIAKLLASRN